MASRDIPIVLTTSEELGIFINRPRLTDRDRPLFDPANPLEEALRRAVIEPARGKPLLYQALLMEPLYVPISPLPGGTVEGVRARTEPYAPMGGTDRLVPLFSSAWRCCDGLPLWPLPQWRLPQSVGRGALILHDLAGANFILNPFSRYSRRLPAREAADLLAGRLAPLRPAQGPARESEALRPLPLASLPPGFADALRVWCRTQPDLLSAYVAEWDMPAHHPDAGLVLLLIGLDPDRLVPHGALPLLLRHFAQSHLKKVSVQPLPLIPPPNYDDTLHQQLRFMQPIYVVGGAPALAMLGPVTD